MTRAQSCAVFIVCLLAGVSLSVRHGLWALGAVLLAEAVMLAVLVTQGHQRR